MKKPSLHFALHSFSLYLLLGLLSTLPVSLSAQVYPGSLTLNDQAAVDAFSYTEVTGSLYISGYQIN
ncbi:MAG: hypothetical protein KDE26_31810, partial [Bacteroidetes bacterium]|nr:hypothetical protein [Bacteroidota bacterium]